MRLHGVGRVNREDAAKTKQELANSHAETKRLRDELRALRAAHAAVTAGTGNGHAPAGQPVS